MAKVENHREIHNTIDTVIKPINGRVYVVYNSIMIVSNKVGNVIIKVIKETVSSCVPMRISLSISFNSFFVSFRFCVLVFGKFNFLVPPWTLLRIGVLFHTLTCCSNAIAFFSRQMISSVAAGRVFVFPRENCKIILIHEIGGANDQFYTFNALLPHQQLCHASLFLL